MSSQSGRMWFQRVQHSWSLTGGTARWKHMTPRTHRKLREQGLAFLDRHLSLNPRHERVHLLLQLQQHLVVCAPAEQAIDAMLKTVQEWYRRLAQLPRPCSAAQRNAHQQRPSRAARPASPATGRSSLRADAARASVCRSVSHRWRSIHLPLCMPHFWMRDGHAAFDCPYAVEALSEPGTHGDAEVSLKRAYRENTPSSCM